ncbi:MAG: DUF1573 domain-containing protein [Phycisphaerae bacterium]
MRPFSAVSSAVLLSLALVSTALAQPTPQAPPAKPGGQPAVPPGYAPPRPPAQPLVDPNGPIFECLEGDYDFGTVWAGKNIEHSFQVRNPGKQELQIFDVKPTCGCTAVPNYQRVIKPGETGAVGVLLNTSHQRDKIEKSLEVVTNEPGSPKRWLKLHGTVRTVAKFDPIGQNYFNGINETPNMERDLIVTNTSGMPLKLELEPPSPAATFEASIAENKAKPGQEFTVHVKAKGPFPEGSTNQALIFRTNIPESPMWQLDLSAFRPPRIQVNPPKMLVDGNQRVEQKRPLTVINNGNVPLDVLSVKASHPAFNPVITKKDTKFTTIEVTIPAFYRPTMAGQYVVIETSDAEKHLITVPILPYGMPPPMEIVPLPARELVAGRLPSTPVNAVPAVGGKAVVTPPPQPPAAPAGGS